MGSGVKEQLWALLEFMEEGDNDETERIFCTTDVHKAFDQVYRNGTIYLLYGMGVRGMGPARCSTCWISGSVGTMQCRSGEDTLETGLNLLLMV